MAEDDIYHSKQRYENFKTNLNNLTAIPRKEDSARKYYCKNSINLKYFRTLFDKFETKDISYTRRLRLLNQLKIVVFCTDKDISKLQRDDIDKVIQFVNKALSDRGRKDFIIDIKYICSN